MKTLILSALIIILPFLSDAQNFTFSNGGWSETIHPWTGVQNFPPIPRKPLIEHFTSSTCAPCAAACNHLDDALSNSAFSFSRISYPMNWPWVGDPYFTMGANYRRYAYNLSYVPIAYTDAENEVNSANYALSYLSNAQQVTAKAFVKLEARVDTLYQKVKIRLLVSPTIDLISDEVIRVAVVEKETYENVMGSGHTKFDYVFKRFLPYAGGIQLSGKLNAYDTMEVKMNYQFQGYYRLPLTASDTIDNQIEHSIEEFDDLVAVVWIQNDTDNEIYQSDMEAMDIIPDTLPITIMGKPFYVVGTDTFQQYGNKIVPMGMDDVSRSDLTVYPNPASEQIEVRGAWSDAVNTVIMDQKGSVMLEQNGVPEVVDVAAWSEGIYYFSVFSSQDKRTIEFVVRR